MENSLLSFQNVQVEEYPIATIKKIEPYKTSEDRVKVIFQVPEGLSMYFFSSSSSLLLCSSNAVNYKIPKPLVLQFINKKERYIFTNLITYIHRYQNDLIAHRLQSKINSKEHTLGIVKWPVAEVFVLSWFQNLCSFRIRVVSHYISSFISPFLWQTAESSSLRLVNILPSISFFLLSLMFQQRDSIRECKDDYQGQIWGG